MSPSRRDLNLRVILEPPVQTCWECQVTESCMQLMRCNRDRNLQHQKLEMLESGPMAAILQVKKSDKTPRAQVSPVSSSVSVPSNKGPHMLPSHPPPLACALTDFPGLKENYSDDFSFYNKQTKKSGPLDCLVPGEKYPIPKHERCVFMKCKTMRHDQPKQDCTWYKCLSICSEDSEESLHWG